MTKRLNWGGIVWGGLVVILALCIVAIAVVILTPDKPPPTLEGPGWRMVSVEEYALRNDTYITFGIQSKNWSQAVAAGWLYNVAYSYDGTQYQFAYEFYANEGYWIKQKVGPLRFSADPNVLFCGKLWFNGTSTIDCTKIIISQHYTNIIQCKTLHASEMAFHYYGINVTAEE